MAELNVQRATVSMSRAHCRLSGWHRCCGRMETIGDKRSPSQAGGCPNRVRIRGEASEDREWRRPRSCEESTRMDPVLLFSTCSWDSNGESTGVEPAPGPP